MSMIPTTTVTGNIARRYLEAGLSVLPIALDGSKAPAWPDLPRQWNEAEKKFKHVWEPFQTRRATAAELRQWFDRSRPVGIGIACGAVSGNLVVLDFETQAAYDRWLGRLAAPHPEVLDRCPLVLTPGGGIHI